MRRLAVGTLLFASATAHAGGGRGAGIGVHAAVGTDVTLGLAVGAGVTWLLGGVVSGAATELGGQIFHARSSESSTEGVHRYDEKTEITVLAIRANFLFRYAPRTSGTFFALGTGAAAVSASWEERSPTDTSLGTPLPGGGSMQDSDGTVGGLILSAGIGRTFGSGLEARLDLPVLYLVSAVGGAPSLVPTVTASLGYRF